jgi:hypothetical protein
MIWTFDWDEPIKELKLFFTFKVYYSFITFKPLKSKN